MAGTGAHRKYFFHATASTKGILQSNNFRANSKAAAVMGADRTEVQGQLFRVFFGVVGQDALDAGKNQAKFKSGDFRSVLVLHDPKKKIATPDHYYGDRGRSQTSTRQWADNRYAIFTGWDLSLDDLSLGLILAAEEDLAHLVKGNGQDVSEAGFQKYVPAHLKGNLAFEAVPWDEIDDDRLESELQKAVTAGAFDPRPAPRLGSTATHRGGTKSASHGNRCCCIVS